MTIDEIKTGRGSAVAKYRLVQKRQLFRPQIKRWLWPFWVTMFEPNWSRNEEEAERYLREWLKEKEKKIIYLGKLP